MALDAAPCKKFPNETYPEFFLKYQIPRLIKLKNKQSQTESNHKNENTEIIRIGSDLEESYRNSELSGYFVHGFGKIEVNEYFEKKTPYLYHKTDFPKEINTKSHKKHNINNINKEMNEYLLFEEDEQKMRDLAEIERMISINASMEEAIIGSDEDSDYDQPKRLKKGNMDIIDAMDDFFNDKDASDRELNDFGNFDDDDM
eukprot:282053_1